MHVPITPKRVNYISIDRCQEADPGPGPNAKNGIKFQCAVFFPIKMTKIAAETQKCPLER